MIYVVIQKGHAIFGTGQTKQEAVEDMKEWINKDSDLQDLTADDFDTSYNSAHDGQMVLVELTEELADDYGVSFDI